MGDMSSDLTVSRVRRRRLTYSLRSMLVAVTITAALIVLVGRHFRIANRQRTAVESIRVLGGVVRYDFQYPSGSVTRDGPGPRDGYDPQATPRVPGALIDGLGIDFFHSVVYVDLTPFPKASNGEGDTSALRLIGQVPSVQSLAIPGHMVSDESLKAIQHLRNLRSIMLFDATELSDDGIGFLASNIDLRYISIHRSGVTDESMKLFAGLPQLKGLSLQFGTATYSNRMLEHISGAEQLKMLSLGLGNLSIDDGGVEHLLSLRQLERLDLQGSSLSDDGISRLVTLSNLKSLCVWGSADAERTITDASVAALTQLDLEKLIINRCQISDTGVLQLQAMPRLKTLMLSSSEVTLDTMTTGRHVRPTHAQAVPGKRLWAVESYEY